MRRFNPEQRTHFLVGQCVDIPVRTLPDVTEALMQIIQKSLTADVFELIVQYHALQVTEAADLAISRAANEQIIFPSRSIFLKKPSALI